MPPDWNTFFADYAAASGDPARVAAFYADAFVGAGPRGSGSFKNDESFLEWLRQMDEAHRRVGLESIVVASTDATAISPQYTSVTVEWSARFQRADAQDVRFRITYVVDHVAEPRIILFVSHEDEQEEMRRLGLA